MNVLNVLFFFLWGGGGGIFNSNPQSILREVLACPHDPKAVSFRLVTFLLEAPGITSINEAVFWYSGISHGGLNGSSLNYMNRCYSVPTVYQKG